MEHLIRASCFVSVILLLLLTTCMQCDAQLSPTFYDTTCPNALSTIRTSIRLAVSKERRMAASLIRLHFHDCFVQGCDASVLLEQSATIQSEQNAFPNLNSARGFDVIKATKAQVESVCPGVVSCADILAVAARDASSLWGPTWQVKLGRRDSTTANFAQANTDLVAFFEDLNSIISKFAAKGLNPRDMVALSGAHSIGQGRCITFRDRIYSNGTELIDAGFASTRRRACPATAPTGDNNLAPIDLVTPNQLDNKYFIDLIQKKGLFHSDQALYNGVGGSTDSIVIDYSQHPATFAADFAAAMIKMGDIQTLTGQSGIIRKTCSAPN